MILPTITLGGTKKAVLIEELCAAKYAVGLAEIAHSKTCPHPRDYTGSYPGRNDHFLDAMRDHTRRREALGWVIQELDELVNAIDELPGE